MVPPQAILISSYQVISAFGLVNSYFALIFTYLSWTPAGILIMRAFFSSQPKEIEDAARIDGCCTFAIFRKIAIPLAKPALATVAIFYFVWVWNDFIFPLIYLHDDIKATIPLGLMQFRGKYSVNWASQCAALSIAVFPPLIFYFIFQDKFVRALSAGALKG
jgi:ABC-type glycerol-3-phosphate transport system permease component